MIMIIIYTYHNVRGGHQTTSNNQLTQSIVLIDLHQLNSKNSSRQYKSATLNTGQPHVNEEQTTQNNNPQHPLSNQMIEQINIALEQKGQEFLSLGH